MSIPTFAYVANTNKVSVIDTSTNTIVTTIPVLSPGDITKDIAITPDGAFAYVTNLSDTVAVIDTCTNTVVDTITVGDFPAGIAITPNGDFAYVANSGLATSPSGTISVIDTSTNTVVTTIPVDRDPIGIAITPDGNFAYVTIAKADAVSVIDTETNTVLKSIPVGDFPQGIAIAPDGSFAYVANQGQSAAANTVSVINLNTNTVAATITVGTAPTNVAITPDGQIAYVTNAGNETVSVIDTDTNSVLKNIPVGACPFDIALTPDGNFAYVTNACDDSVSVIGTSTNTVSATIPIGDLPLGIAIADIEFPCPAPSERICIEVDRIFDSCMFELEQQKCFEFSRGQDTSCEITKTECTILEIIEVDGQQDVVDVKLQIKVFLSFGSKRSGDHDSARVISFEKNVTLTNPEGADLFFDVTNAACTCIQQHDTKSKQKLTCTVKVTATVKSKKRIQVEVPFLRSCEPEPCISDQGALLEPGQSYPFPNEPSEVSKIFFEAKTNPGMTSRVIAFLNGLPAAFAIVTDERNPFELVLPGGPHPVGNVSLRNTGDSMIYLYHLMTE
ncbi:beta-propeller fold lactonase family protein [Bacillus marinisedimentorum]|uniref:beta-propeller fold lactonase family protein n=1 Tax=Bacillus marinisedimentorum TaxID=1821260 RepID=UPI0008729492|nr:YncE family protein [Bacillus marinisedimentorum]